MSQRMNIDLHPCANGGLLLVIRSAEGVTKSKMPGSVVNSSDDFFIIPSADAENIGKTILAAMASRAMTVERNIFDEEIDVE